MPPVTFWEHAWQAKWGVVVVAFFVFVIGAVLVSISQREHPLADCEASGGRLVIPKLDERKPQPSRFKHHPGVICKHD